jgi:hypothetical protein
VARGVSVHARKQRNASSRQLAIRGRFGSQASSCRCANVPGGGWPELLFPGLNANWPHLKYHLSHVGVVTFMNMSQRVPRFVKSGLTLVCNVRFNGSIRWKDYNVFDLIFHTTAEALCFVKNLAKLFTTMFHLFNTIVLIMTQCPASGFSALIGYGGRCTARIVSEETKKSSPIIIATNVFFKTTREWLVFPFPTSFYGKGGTKFPKITGASPL